MSLLSPWLIHFSTLFSHFVYALVFVFVVVFFSSRQFYLGGRKGHAHAPIQEFVIISFCPFLSLSPTLSLYLFCSFRKRTKKKTVVFCPCPKVRACMCVYVRVLAMHCIADGTSVMFVQPTTQPTIVTPFSYLNLSILTGEDKGLSTGLEWHLGVLFLHGPEKFLLGGRDQLCELQDVEILFAVLGIDDHI